MNRSKLIGFGLGPLATGLLGALTIPLVAWIFTPEDVGRLYILQTIVSFAVLFMYLGLDQAYVREFHESKKPASLLRSTFLPGLAIFAVILFVGVIFAEPLSSLLFGVPNPNYSWLTIACVFFAFTSRHLSLILRMKERALAYSVSQVLPKTLFFLLLASIPFTQLPRGFIQLQSALLASSVVAFLVYLWSTRHDWMPAVHASVDPRTLGSLLKFAFPLVLASLVYWGLSVTSAFTLRALSSFEEVGIYSVSMSVAGVATVFQSIFSVVWAPVVYKWVAQGADLSRVDLIARQALAVVVGVFLLCGMFSWVVEFFLPNGYAGVRYLVLCSIVQPLLYTMSEVTGIGITITRRTTFSLWATMLALIVNLFLNVWLVPAYGASGAVVSNAIAFLIFFVGRTEFSAHVWRQIPRSKIYVFVVGAVAMSVVSVIAGPAIGQLISFVWAGAGAISIWAFRTEGRTLIRMIWRRRDR
jgi:O-antigen/teichoic acid export membrane protein